MAIKISIEHGKVKIKPYYAKCRRHSLIQWTSDKSRAWTIGFKNNVTPTDTLVVQGNGPTMDGEHTADRTGHYPYMVSVEVREEESRGPLTGKRTILLDIACPEIIID